MSNYNNIANCDLYFGNRNKPTDKCSHNGEFACNRCNPQLFSPTQEQAKHFSSVSIASKLIKAKKAYYGSGKTLLTDFEYDRLEESLRAIDPSNPILTQVGS